MIVQPLVPGDTLTIPFYHLMRDLTLSKKYYIDISKSKVDDNYRDKMRYLFQAIDSNKLLGYKLVDEDNIIRGLCFYSIDFNFATLDKEAKLLWLHILKEWDTSVNQYKLYLAYERACLNAHCSYQIVSLCNKKSNKALINKLKKDKRYKHIIYDFGRKLCQDSSVASLKD